MVGLAALHERIVAIILLGMTTGVRDMRNIGHVSANVATLHETHLPTILGGPTQSRPHALSSAFRKWFERGRQRRALAELDDRLLRDIGVTFEQARREAARPFWSASRA
jgi:uncharacterized protein YjiS (DUF1127 family)